MKAKLAALLALALICAPVGGAWAEDVLEARETGVEIISDASERQPRITAEPEDAKEEPAKVETEQQDDSEARAFVCAHSDVDGKRTLGEAYYVRVDARGHREMFPILVSGVCARCGKTLTDHKIGVEKGEYQPHQWKNGVCAKCGYACAHPDAAITEKLSKPYATYKQYDRYQHQVTRTRAYRTICENCGEVLYEDEESLGTTFEAHELVNGVCPLCGYDVEAE